MNSETVQIPPWWMVVIFGKNPRRTLLRLSLLVALTFILFKFLVLPIQVSGVSMEPAYLNGKVNFVNQLAYTWARPKRFDVVAIRMPGQRSMLLKRIVGLPGERVALRGGFVYVNGDRLEEPYVRLKGFYPPKETTLEPDHYFVIGDNRSVSVYLPVPVWQIVGKVMF
jgi:signal peptidase I